MRTTTMILAAAILLCGPPMTSFAQEVPPGVTREDLAKDNKLFLAVARKALKWDEPSEPAKIVGPLLLRRDRRPGVLPLRNQRRAHPLQHRYAGVRSADRRIDPKARLRSEGHQSDDQWTRPLRSRRSLRLLQEADRRAGRDYGAGRRDDRGRRKSDFHYSRDWQIMGQPPVKVDRVLRDGDTVRLGEVLLIAHHTPGHTRGATTWETTVVDNGRAYHVIWPDGGGFNPGYRIGKEPSVLSRHQRRLPADAPFSRNAEAGYFPGRPRRVVRLSGEARARQQGGCAGLD